MKSTKLDNTSMNATKADNNEYGNEELIKREQIKDTPFTIITTEKNSFGVMGEYRVTEELKNVEEVKKELEKITWNRIIQVMMILGEIKEKQNNKK